MSSTASHHHAPRSIQEDIASILEVLPAAKVTFTANLFGALCAQLLGGREGSISDRDAWESAGYPQQYPGAVFSTDQLRATVNNLRVALRKLHADGKTKCLWVVERVKGEEEGFRLRVLDPVRCRAFSGDWMLRHYDPEVWATKHTIQFLDEPGVRLPHPLRQVAVIAVAGLALAATGWAGVAGTRLWQENARVQAMLSRRDALTVDAFIAQITCTSSIWEEMAKSPDHDWSRCGHAADGQLIGRGWSSVEDKSSRGDKSQEWIHVTLREPAQVDSLRLHWQAEQSVCVFDPELEENCRAPGQPELIMVEGSMDGLQWVVLLDEEPCPGMAPWEPMDVVFEPMRLQHIRVTALDKRRDKGEAATFQLAEIVVNPIPLEDYRSELPTPEMFANAGN